MAHRATAKAKTDRPRRDVAPAPVESKARKGRQRRSDGELTRARVIESAVECILEAGYYQTSTNDIAKRSGVTWGALQYQFGNREGLLLEVLNSRWHDLQSHIGSARITGETLEERLESVLQVLSSHYAEPAHLAHLQILLDLSHDPRTSEAARKAVAIHGSELTREWHSLFEQALGETAADEEIMRYAFLVTRGYLTGQLISSSIATTADDTVVRKLLINGIACAIREHVAVRATTRRTRP
jgi:AcrR family transcriptional regulator